MPEGNYWHNFYADQRPWGQIPHFWKYVCTYCLSVKTSDFKKLGWFTKTFHYYGFEDTDLGYRFAKANKSFLLMNEEVYHLFHADQRSEYANSDYQRFLLLKKTAQIFFLSHLEKEVAAGLGELIKPTFSLAFLRKGYRWLNHKFSGKTPREFIH